MTRLGSRLARVLALASTAFLVSICTSASAHQTPREQSLAQVQSERAASLADSDRAALAAPPRHHDGLANHLPPVQQEMELVGEVELTAPFGDVLPGQIADVSVYKNAAYLMSWAIPDPGQTECTRGGVFIVDISEPANPTQQGFIPALPETYHGEGAQTITINTPAFQGDVLAVNNEPCGDAGVGGFDLYDVTDPTNPQTLVQGVGDQSPDDGTVIQDPAEVPNSSHSIFIWQQGARAFAVIVDNTELHDVDIFDITDPRNPEFIADLDLVELFPQIVANSANGNSIFHHDVIVKQIAERPVMLVSYWDAGYVQLDVTNPVNPTYITDTNFANFDPLITLDPPGPPEGNAHQAEFSHDNQFILAADEDFTTGRSKFEITEGPHAGVYPSGEFGFTRPISQLPDELLNGPTIFGGYGCTADNQIPPATDLPPLDPGEEAIVVLQRGPEDDPNAPYDACRFDEKIQNADDKGYEAAVIAQRHLGDEASDGAFCGGGDPRDIVGVCVSHQAMHRIFDTEPNYDLPYPPPPNTEPVEGTLGAHVSVVSQFDGWGYTHLYDAATSEELDAFAIPEALDERYASGFGDLTVHEFATDPTENLAYSSYYAGGMRVFRFSRAAGLEQVGAYIDPDGSNFWGVEQFTRPDGQRLIAGSDRDFGLQIFRYTGPGAAQPPRCDATQAVTARGEAVSVALPCTDPNANPLTRKVTGGPANGTVGEVTGDSVLYTPNAEFIGTDTFTFVANDGAADSAPATARVVVLPPNDFQFGKLKRNKKKGTAKLTVILPGPGELELKKTKKLKKATKDVDEAGKVKLRIAPRAKAKRKLVDTGKLKARAKVTYTPTGGDAGEISGDPRTKSKKVKLVKR